MSDRTDRMIDAVEASYLLDTDERTWLQSVCDVSLKSVSDGNGAMAFSFDLNRRPPVDPALAAFVNLPAESERGFMQNLGPVLDYFVPQVLGSLQCRTLSEAVAINTGGARDAYGMALQALAGQDCLGIVAWNPGDYGVIVAPLLRGPRTLPPGMRERWLRVAAHLAAGLRLRRALDVRPGGRSGDGEAIVDPAGRVHHAEGPAKTPTGLEVLRQAVRSVDRARGPLRRSDPDEAIGLWRALTAGRWSIVDRFESDGSRYYVAHRNEAAVTAPAALTPRERQVVAYIAKGHGDKLVAYELGLSPSTVASILSSARRKLRVGSRVELIQTVRDLGGSSDGDG